MGAKGGVFGGLSEGERLNSINNFYEGASRTYRLANKGVSSAGADSNLASRLTTLRNRSRTLIANNPYGETAVTSYAANVVGKGFTAKFKNKKLQVAWNKWIEECDADGMSNLSGLAELTARAEFSDGEVLLRKRPRRKSDGLTVPLQLQVLEADYLDVGYDDQNKRVLHGIQFNGVGKRTGYHVFKSHPGERKLGLEMNPLDRIFVAADDMVHTFRRLRPGQNRGVPKMANIIVRLYEIDEMQDGLLAKQKIAQLFGWIVKRPKAEEDDLTKEQNTVGEIPVVGEETETEDGTIITKIKSGGVHYLDEGEEVDFSTPDGVGSNYIDWLKSELRVCAKGIGLTYEQFTGDLSGVNYTSIRAGVIEFRRAIEQVQYHLYAFRFYRTIARWFNDAAVMAGVVDISNYWDDPTEHLPTFKAQGWDHVDPLKDRTADLIDSRSGFNSRRNIIDSRGGDVDDIDRELIEDALGDLILDSIPAKTTKTGIIQTSLNAGDDSGGGEEPKSDKLDNEGEEDAEE